MDILNYRNINKVILVDPNFPTSRKSRNHRDLLPVGLLKIGAALKNNNVKTILVRLSSKENFDEDKVLDFYPDLIMLTYVFTYWADEVKEAVSIFKKLFPTIPIIVGGVFASLMPKKCKEYTKCDDVFIGVMDSAEHIAPDYSLLGEDESKIDFQIVHATRGCKRKCGFCGVYKIEPNFSYITSIKDELIRKNLVFYDNNLLASPYIEKLLEELIELKKQRIISNCESQSGFDGRILRNKPHLAKLLKNAGFKNPKIAWDGSVKSYKKRKEEIDVLINAGYKPKDIAVFMIYNYELNFKELEEKRIHCFKWGVQISDCRYRPLDRLDDNYNPYAKKPQSNEDYHINPNWSDEEVRQFRRNVRQHNICIRHEMDYYSNAAERKKISKKDSLRFRSMSFEEAKNYLSDAWNPLEINYPYVNKTSLDDF